MFCKKNGGYIAIIISVLIALTSAYKSSAETFEGLDVKVEGKGPAVVFIPGLNSGASVLLKHVMRSKKTNAIC